MIWKVTEGHTKPLKFRLKYVDDNGVVQNLDTTGMTISLHLTKADLTPVDTAGDTASIAPGTSGIVEYSPDPGDFVAADGPYLSKFKVMDGGGKVDMFPRSEHDTCQIFKL